LRRSRKIFGRGIGGPEIFLECGLRRRGLFRDKSQLQVVDDPVDNGMLREEGDDRSASTLVVARTRLWSEKPVCCQERMRSAHSGLRSSLRTRSAKTSRAKISSSRESSIRGIIWF